MTPNINHKYIKSKRRGQNRFEYTQMTTRQGIDHLVEIEIHHTEEEEILVEILDKIIEEDNNTIIGMTIEETIIENRGLEIGVVVEIITGILIEVVKTLERTICKVVIMVKIEVGQDNHAAHLEEKREGIEVGQYQDQNQVQV